MTKEIRERLEALAILENADLSKIDIATPNEIIALVDHLIIERICQYDKIICDMFVKRKNTIDSDFTKLLMEKINILKLKADDYNWQCHTPKDVKDELEKQLVKIDKIINENE